MICNLGFNIIRYGSNAVLISFKKEITIETHHKVRFLYESLRKFPAKGIVALTPAYHSLVVYFEAKIQDLNGITELTKNTLECFDVKDLATYEVILPVCYDVSFGLDINNVLEHTGLNLAELIAKHTMPQYLVYMIGFVPGFLYLGGLNNDLNTPRLKSPRMKIPKGSVGIADNQTGVYPLSTPGGWQIIGNCPLNLIGTNTKTAIEMGDVLKFKPITIEEHMNLLGEFPERRLLK
jgi:inhibitor of KinA